LHVKRIGVDLVILNEQSTSYAEGLQQDLESRARESNARTSDDTSGRGAIYILRADLMNEEETDLLLAAARAVIVCRRGNLATQLSIRPREGGAPLPPRLLRRRPLLHPLCSFRTDSAGSPRAGTNTPLCSIAAREHRCRGSTSSRTRKSASRCRSQDPATDGRPTAA